MVGTAFPVAFVRFKGILHGYLCEADAVAGTASHQESAKLLPTPSWLYFLAL